MYPTKKELGSQRPGDRTRPTPKFTRPVAGRVRSSSTKTQERTTTMKAFRHIATAPGLERATVILREKQETAQFKLDQERQAQTDTPSVS